MLWASIVPIEGTANGKVVIDGTVMGVGYEGSITDLFYGRNKDELIEILNIITLLADHLIFRRHLEKEALLVSKHIEKAEKLCNGCRSCEIACSLVNKEVFSPENSNVLVLANNREPAVTIKIKLDNCESCPSTSSSPPCVQFCPTGALQNR